MKKLPSTDTSIARAPAKKPVSKEVKFIDGIEVAPGDAVSSNHKTIATKRKEESARKEPATATIHKDDAGLKEVHVEKADWLQLKYAVMMDAPVEELTNVSLLQKIEEWWGTKYCLGGKTKNCIDCSAFTQTLMKDVYDITLPRTASEQYKMSEKVDVDDMKEGDLVFFRTSGKSISHVGIYITNNKFVNASTSGGVTISDLNDYYWKPRFKGAGRVLKG